MNANQHQEVIDYLGEIIHTSEKLPRGLTSQDQLRRIKAVAIQAKALMEAPPIEVPPPTYAGGWFYASPGHGLPSGGAP